MAIDEVLLQGAVAGHAALRFYGWLNPTISLGYFQSEKTRLADALLTGLPFVRRPSGGKMLVHHHELTYALALPAGSIAMHEIIAAALGRFGIEARLGNATQCRSTESPLCFEQISCSDLVVGNAKVVGSAQRKQRGALLQHGAILLRQSPHTPTLPGIQELTQQTKDAAQLIDAINQEFIERIRANLDERPLSAAEQEQVGELRAQKYATSAWNCKR
jgi:lipoate-protein ligase A